MLHHNDLSQVTRELRAMEGSPKFGESQTLPDVDVDFAAFLGLQAITVTDPDDLGAAWDRALSADRPTVIDVHTDPNVPPIPPHATFEQMKDAAKSILKGARTPGASSRKASRPRLRSSSRRGSPEMYPLIIPRTWWS